MIKEMILDNIGLIGGVFGIVFIAAIGYYLKQNVGTNESKYTELCFSIITVSAFIGIAEVFSTIFKWIAK